jgi:uncharacterized protein (DUF433 family)
MHGLDRITQSPDGMGGKACIRGLGVTVGMVVGQIDAGHSIASMKFWATIPIWCARLC